MTCSNHSLYYDHEIVTELIRRTNLAEEYIRSIEEKNPVPVFAVTTGRTFLSIGNPLAEQQVSVLSEEGRIIQPFMLLLFGRGRGEDYLRSARMLSTAFSMPRADVLRQIS